MTLLRLKGFAGQAEVRDRETESNLLNYPYLYLI